MHPSALPSSHSEWCQPMKTTFTIGDFEDFDSPFLPDCWQSLDNKLCKLWRELWSDCELRCRLLFLVQQYLEPWCHCHVPAVKSPWVHWEWSTAWLCLQTLRSKAWRSRVLFSVILDWNIYLEYSSNQSATEAFNHPPCSCRVWGRSQW